MDIASDLSYLLIQSFYESSKKGQILYIRKMLRGATVKVRDHAA